MRNRIAILIAVIFYSLFLFNAPFAGSIGNAWGEDLITLRYGQNAANARSLSSLPLSMAQRKGFLVREGINLTLIPIAGGTDNMVAALDNGTTDIVKTATPYLIQAVLNKGSDSVAIASETTNPVYSLIVRPEIKSFADLKGKVIGFSTPGDTITISTRKLLTLKGVKPSDYQAKELVGTPARFDCVKTGECAAVPMGEPEDFGAIEKGFPSLGITNDVTGDLVFNVTAVSRAWGEKHKDVLVRFNRAMAASFKYIRDPENREEMTTIVMEITGVPRDVAIKAFAPYLDPDKHVLPKQGELNMNALRQVIALMGEAGVVPSPLPPPERFVDLQYLKAAGIQ